MQNGWVILRAGVPKQYTDAIAATDLLIQGSTMGKNDLGSKPPNMVLCSCKSSANACVFDISAGSLTIGIPALQTTTGHLLSLRYLRSSHNITQQLFDFIARGFFIIRT